MITMQTHQQPPNSKPTQSTETPRWAQWTGYLMCAWSLLFAALHFAAEADWMPNAQESQHSRPDPFAWLLCIAMLCVIGAVTTLALLQARKHVFPGWFMRVSTLSSSALLFIYVLFSFWVDGSHWALAPGVLCAIGAVVALALTQPWGKHLPRWLMLLFVWLGGVILTLHALYGYVVHGLAAVGILTWTQVQQWAGAPVTPLPAEAVSDLIRASMLIWNPWFLLGGILYLAVAWYSSRHATVRVRAVDTRHLLLILVGGFLLMSKPGMAQSPLDAAAIDQFITAQMATQRVPGLAVAIVQGNQVRMVNGYGAARANEPMTPQAQLLVASLSKSFTAVATMQLVEAGKLALDAPVQRYLPEFTLADPAATQQITVRQLLNQVSGLSDAGFPAMRLPAPKTLAERITSLRTARLVAPPGTQYHYFDINYQILARLVEVASGQPFSDYMQAHVFTPLQMPYTVNLITSDDIVQKPTNLAQGHLLAYGLPIASGEETGFMAGSSGIATTAEDMAHYLIMQNNGGRFQDKQLLSAQSVALLHTPPTNLNSPYAMGWLTATTPSGVQHLEHNGILSTFYAEMVLLPETNQGFVLLYNIHSLAQDALGAPPIKAGLIDLLTGRQPQTGGFSVTTWAILMGVLTLLCVGLEMRGLVRLSRWRQQAATKPLWRHLVNIVWSFAPAAFVLAMPAIVLSSAGRAYGYLTLFRSMLDSFGWLTVCALLGAVNGLVRLVWLFRRAK